MEGSAKSRSLTAYLASICCWNFIVSVDSTALSTALPTIAQDLHAPSTQAFWSGTAFVLCSAAFQPVLSSFSDLVGRKPVIFFSLLVFTAGAVVCSLAHHVSVLLVGRCLQGTGAGGLLTMTYVLTADELTLSQRHKAITVISLTWLVGPVIGPIISGTFTEQATWRWIFWFNLPFCAIGTIVPCFMRVTHRPKYDGLACLKHFDYLGSVLFVLSLTAFLIALSSAGTQFPWSSWQTLVPLILGAAGLGLWTLYSLYLTLTPMIPLHLIFTNRTAAISYFGNLAQGIIFYGMLYYLPLYFQAVKLFTPITSAIALLPCCLTSGPFAAIAGIIIGKTHRIKPLVMCGWSMFAIGMGLFLLLDKHTPTAGWIFIEMPAGIGLGTSLAALSMATQSAVEICSDKTPEEIERVKGVAAGLNPFFRTVGQTIGIVIAQAAFTNELKHHLGEGAANDATALARVIRKSPAGAPGRMHLIHGFSVSLHPVWWTLLGVALAMLATTLVTKDVGLGPILLAPCEEDGSGKVSEVSSCGSSGTFTNAMISNPQPGIKEVAESAVQ